MGLSALADVAWSSTHTARPAVDLVKEHRNRIASGELKSPEAERMHFTLPLTPGKTFYNPTGLFSARVRPGEPLQEIMAVRVEDLQIEEGSEVKFFTPAGRPVKGALTFGPKGNIVAVQDPSYARIGNEHTLAMVEAYHQPGLPLGYHTAFYRDFGKGVGSLERFAVGPEKEKDVRLVELQSGKVLVFRRPQGGVAGPGKIGALTIDSLADLNADAISKGRILEGQFADGEWGGVNAAYAIPTLDGNEIVVAVGHIAHYDANNNKVYNLMHFGYRPDTGEYTPMTIFLERRDLAGGLSGPKKTDQLADVVFMGGGEPDLSSGTYQFKVGAGDAEVQSVSVGNFFRDYQ